MTGKLVGFVLAVVFFVLYEVDFVRSETFDVTKFGAKGDGKPVYSDEGESLNGLAFMHAWHGACDATEPSKVVIPKGTFVVAQVVFSGPCHSHINVELQGTITPDPDMAQFPNKELIVFQQVEGASFTGTGLISGSLSKATPVTDPEEEIVFMDVMPSITLSNVTNFVLDGIHSMNPVNFHVLVYISNNVTIGNVNLDTKNAIEPKTHSNGIYIASSRLVAVNNAFVRTGDDCITISGGSSNVSIAGVTCAEGEGISVGTQPIRMPEADVKAVRVTNCTFKKAASGARIDPRPHAKLGQVSDIIFEDLVMEDAQNPIIVTQDYPTKPDKQNYAKITDVHFKNIRGTTTTDKAVSISCSQKSPCDNVEVADINLSFTGKGPGLSASCQNAKVTFGGKHDGLSCN